MTQPMKSTILLVATATILATLGTACGKNPESQEDRIKQQLNQGVAEKEAILSPLTGRYEGTLTSPDGLQVQKATMIIIPTIMIVQNPGRSDVTEMPTLGGNVNIVFDPNNSTDVIPVAQFTSSSYSPETRHLRMNGTINTGTSIGAVITSFDGKFGDDTIQGQLFNSTRGNIGQLEVRKVGPAPTISTAN